MKKKALGIITCDRPDYFKKCINSIPKNIEAIVINDGKLVHSNLPVFHNKTNIGVGRSKNLALSYFYKKGIEHIFLIEDDMIIKDDNVFDVYIETAAKNNIKHLNFGLSAKNNPLLEKKNGMDLYKNPYAGFSYFHNSIIERVGFFDDQFYNALEHIDYTLRISLAGLHTPLPFYADIEDSYKYLNNVEENFKGSIIRKNYPQFKVWISKAIELFIIKWGIHPAKISSRKWIEWMESSPEYVGAVKNT